MKWLAVATGLVAVTLLTAPGTILGATHQVATTPAPQATGRMTTQTVNWQIPLTAGSRFPRASGSAQYQAQPGQRELQVEMEHLRALAGRSLVVRVDGARAGTMKVSRTGIAQLTLNSEVGRAVPAVRHGSLVTVATGVVIASGTF